MSSYIRNVRSADSSIIFHVLLLLYSEKCDKRLAGICSSQYLPEQHKGRGKRPSNGPQPLEPCYHIEYIRSYPGSALPNNGTHLSYHRCPNLSRPQVCSSGVHNFFIFSNFSQCMLLLFFLLDIYTRHTYIYIYTHIMHMKAPTETEAGVLMENAAMYIQQKRPQQQQLVLSKRGSQELQAATAAASNAAVPVKCNRGCCGR